MFSLHFFFPFLCFLISLSFLHSAFIYFIPLPFDNRIIVFITQYKPILNKLLILLTSLICFLSLSSVIFSTLLFLVLHFPQFSLFLYFILINLCLFSPILFYSIYFLQSHILVSLVVFQRSYYHYFLLMRLLFYTYVPSDDPMLFSLFFQLLCLKFNRILFH